MHSVVCKHVCTFTLYTCAMWYDTRYQIAIFQTALEMVGRAGGWSAAYSSRKSLLAWQRYDEARSMDLGKLGDENDHASVLEWLASVCKDRCITNDRTISLQRLLMHLLELDSVAMNRLEVRNKCVLFP
jgi:hypothetical protein